MSVILAYYLRKPKQSTSRERFGSGEVLFCYMRAFYVGVKQLFFVN